MNLGEAIKKIREKKKLTQKNAADKIGISQQQLSYAESRKDIGGDILKKICDAYEVPPAVVVWMASETSDVAPKKKAIYKMLAPIANAIIKEHIL